MANDFRKRLDRSRDYGQMCPPEHGVHFIQDGYPFDHDGRIVATALTPEQRDALAGKNDDAATGKAAKGSGGKKNPAKAPDQDQRTIGKPQAQPADGDAEINLEAWLKGQEKYQEFKIKQAVRARYSRAFNAIPDIVVFLIGEKVCAPDELAPQFKGFLD